MGTMRPLRVWLVIALMVLSGGSLSYAQWFDCGVNTCTGDNVGIGTKSPDEALHVSGSSTGFGAHIGNLFVGVWDGSSLYSVFAHNAVKATVGSYALIQSSTGATFLNAASGRDIGFRIDNAQKMVLKSTGNVGIGTTSPSSKLHVAGNATVDGNIAAKYQDVAEWVRVGAVLEPGTVVVIDPTKDDQVLPGSQPYDTRVAGVVSAQPGIILGEAGEDKAKVAHSGRVKVKVDAQFGPISVGDLLVSSATTGYAMRSTPIEINGISLHRPGTIVGKALEPLKEGEGEILVLLTLQ